MLSIMMLSIMMLSVVVMRLPRLILDT